MDYLKLGTIIKTRGLKGQVKVYSTTEFAYDRYEIGAIVFLENPENRSKIFNSNNETKERLEVYIGEEDDMKDLSVVKTDLNLNGHSIGKIALVGPTRMDYDKVLSALEYVIERFEEVYNLEEEKNDEERKAN